MQLGKSGVWKVTLIPRNGRLQRAGFVGEDLRFERLSVLDTAIKG